MNPIQNRYMATQARSYASELETVINKAPGPGFESAVHDIERLLNPNRPESGAYIGLYGNQQPRHNRSSAPTYNHPSQNYLALFLCQIRHYGYFSRASKGKNVKDIHRVVLKTINHELRLGHCYTEHQKLTQKVLAQSSSQANISAPKIEEAIKDLESAGTLTATHTAPTRLIARTDILQMEHYLAATFQTAQEPNPIFGRGQTTTARELAGFHLNSGQRKAITTATSNKICIITGCAGTGKTYTIKALWHLYTSRGRRVEIAAPTGKAAKRIQQESGLPASTIHRLLGKAPTVAAEAVIIDECSMVDLELAYQLFKAINPEKTAVVLLGDPNQLPPIGAGNLLRDLSRASQIPKTQLKWVVRQAKTLRQNCFEILKGHVPPTAPAEPGGHTAWIHLNQHSRPEQIQQALLTLLRTLQRIGYDIIKDTQILTPTHSGILGTKQLNQALQRLVQEISFGRHAPPAPSREKTSYYPGDKVIQLRNNYDLGIMNGTLGTVQRFHQGPSRAPTLTIDFEGKRCEIAAESPEIDLAYAITMHKAQGSEWPIIIAIIHSSHAYMHSRNLLYTAVTRAKRTAIILGDAWGTQQCVQKTHNQYRRTLLSLLLASSSKAPQPGTQKQSAIDPSFQSQQDTRLSFSRQATIKRGASPGGETQ